MLLVDVEGAHSGRVTQVGALPHTLMAISNSHLVSVEPRAMQSWLRVYDLDEKAEWVLPVAIRGIMDVAFAGGQLVAVHGLTGTVQVSTIDIASGSVAKLDEFSDPSTSLRFGESTAGSVVLIDPVVARFKHYRPGSGTVATPWISLQSSLVDAARSRPGSVSSMGHGVDSHRLLLVGHRQGPDDSHVFLVAIAERGVGRYAVKTGGDGRELGRALLDYPNGEVTSMNIPAFSTMLSKNDAVAVVTRRGEILTYDGAAK